MARTYINYIVIIKSITRCVIIRWSNSEMPIISVKDNKNNRWKRNAKTETKNKQINKQKKQNKVDGSYSERVRDKWFCWAFKFSPTNM